MATIRNGQLLKVNALGQIVNVIGRLRATIQGNIAIDVYPNTSIEQGAIGTLRSGDIIEILDSQWDWLHIREPNGEEGWIRASIPISGKEKGGTRVNAQNSERNDTSSDGVPSDWNSPEHPDMFGQQRQQQNQPRKGH